jgi:homoserine dehydrogenase
MKIKLLGRAIQKDGKQYVFVSPHFVPQAQMLACVSDVFNAIEVKGSEVGTALFYGPGAGRFPTASAVVADVDKLARGCAFRASFTAAPDDFPTSFSFFSTRRYVVTEGVDQNTVSIIFGDVEPIAGEENAFLTAKMSEKSFAEREKRLSACGGKIVSHIRYYN